MLMVALDDLRHRDAESVFDENDFAPRDEPVVHQDVDGFAHLAIQLEEGARLDREEIADPDDDEKEDSR